MSKVRDRCHDCGAKRTAEAKFCTKCGAGLPAWAELEPGGPTEPAGGMAWECRIPVITNRYTWIRWGWMAAAFGTGFALVLGVPLMIAFGSRDEAATMTKVVVAIFALAALVVLGLGLMAGVLCGNGVRAAYTFEPEGMRLVTRIGGFMDRAENVALAMGQGFTEAHQTAGAFEAMLPGDNDAKWAKVRAVQFDERRRVITLRRKWHNPVRVYVPADRWPAAVAYVREHVPRLAEVGGAAAGAH